MVSLSSRLLSSQSASPVLRFYRPLVMVIIALAVGRMLWLPSSGALSVQPGLLALFVPLVVVGLVPWALNHGAPRDERLVTAGLFGVAASGIAVFSWHTGGVAWWNLPVILGAFAPVWASLGPSGHSSRSPSAPASPWPTGAQTKALVGLALVWAVWWWAVLAGPHGQSHEAYWLSRIAYISTAVALVWGVLLHNLSAGQPWHRVRLTVGYLILSVIGLGLLLSNLLHDALVARSQSVPPHPIGPALVPALALLGWALARFQHRPLALPVAFALGLVYAGVSMAINPSFGPHTLPIVALCWHLLPNRPNRRMAALGWVGTLALAHAWPGTDPTRLGLMSLTGTGVWALTDWMLNQHPLASAHRSSPAVPAPGMPVPRAAWPSSASSAVWPWAAAVVVGLCVPALGVLVAPDPTVPLVQATVLMGVLLGFLSFAGVRSVQAWGQAQHLRAEFSTLESVLQLTSCAISVFDTAGTNVYANPAVATVSGLPLPQVMGFNLFTHPFYVRSGIAEAARQALATGRPQTVSYTGQGSQGQPLALRVRLQRLALAGQPVVLLQADDLSVEETLRQTVQDKLTVLEEVIEGTQAGTWSFDVAQGVSQWNDIAFAKLGYRRDELEPITHAKGNDLLHPDDRAPFFEAFNRHLRGETPRMALEHRVRHRDGHYVWFLNQAQVSQRDADGHARMIRGTFLDITALKQSEQAHRDARQTAERAERAKAQFLSNMSHEMRTPLNGLLGFHRLLAQTPLNDDQRHFVEQSQHAGQHLLSLINDVLDLSKLEDGAFQLNPAPMRPDRVLAEAMTWVRPMADDKGLRLDLAPLPDAFGRWVMGDAQRLRQVLLNLLTNAIKFTDHGHVRVTGWVSPEQPDALSFEVSDTGRGIDEADQAKLFQRFSQVADAQGRDNTGTGLGLAIIKGLVEQMGGSVTMRSALGQGSAFQVQVRMPPATDDAVAHAAQTAEADPASPLGAPTGSRLCGVRVLLVDDSAMNLEVASRLLGGEGAEVSVAPDGQAALQHLRDHGDEVDIVLMDIHMPVMDGYAATRAVRHELAQLRLPILAMSAGASAQDKQTALTSGMNGYVIKPFDLDALVQAMRTHVLAYRGALPDPHAARQAPPATRHEALLAPWPEVPGIVMSEARARMGGDWALFARQLRRYGQEFEAFDATAMTERWRLHAQEVIAWLHTLKGNAGLLAAQSVQRAAAHAETQAKRPANLRALEDALAELAAAHADLLSNSRAVLATWDAAQAHSPLRQVAPNPDPCGESAIEWSDEALNELLNDLDANRFGAQARFKALSPALRQRLGGEAWSQIDRFVVDLNFEAAANALRDGMVIKRE